LNITFVNYLQKNNTRIIPLNPFNKYYLLNICKSVYYDTKSKQ